MKKELTRAVLQDILRHAKTPGLAFAPENHRTAVFLLIYEKNNQPHILGILKADTPGYTWRNQVALPGGHIDPTDANPLEGALRELSEEVGILRDEVVCAGSLGHFQTLQRKDIEVFVGCWNGRADALCFDPGEIARILEIPLGLLIQTHMEKGFRGRVPDWEELIYPFEDLPIWGVTARIFHVFLELLIPHIL